MLAPGKENPLENLPITVAGQPSSHLAVRLERPDEPQDTGLAILYMHGFASDQSGIKAEFFRRSAVELGIAFCSFDFQGHGQSGSSMFGLTLTRNIEDVGRVHGYLRAQGYERIILMGSSMGGGTGLWYAAFHPQDVVAALHIAPSVELHEGLLRWVGPKGAKRWQREGKILFQHDLNECELSWDLVEDLRSFRIERLKTLYRTPTLIFQGKKDDSVPWDKVLDFVVGCSGEEIELHLMADCGHRMVDRTEHVWRLMHEFLLYKKVLAGGR
jgi:pimeloyl-ACP methyl ester carboxylesterase